MISSDRKEISMSQMTTFRIDWNDLREVLRKVVSGNTSDLKRPGNKDLAATFIQGGTWAGFTKGQVERWLHEGYKTETIHGLEDLVPPIREKRKYIFSEDGDEYHHDMMLSGEDNFTSSFTKRETIPGMALEAECSFSGAVDASVVNAYIVWVCKLAISLETAGIDTDITFKLQSRNVTGDGRIYQTSIRVKRENEASDFFAWSPMLSPAAFRAFGFIARLLHCDREEQTAKSSMGQGMSGLRSAWKVLYDSERNVITCQVPYMGSRQFPEEDMTRQFRAALLEMQGKVLAS